MSAMVLMRREVVGGDGADDGISDTAATIAIEINEQLEALKNTVTVARLLQMNLCDNIRTPEGIDGEGGPSFVYSVKVCS